ncbi:MAG: Gfo/Idh/MocA family protein [Terriglobia bacterium]
MIIQQKPGMPVHSRSIVLIGAGGIARDAHLPAYRKAGFTVDGVFDLDPAKARKLAIDFGIGKVHPSLDSAVAAAPAGCVFDVAAPATALLDVLPHLPDGALALIQKPMGENLNEARKILALCRKKRLTAAVNFQLRYAPLVVAARSLIEQGAIGELVALDFRVTVYTPWHLWKFMEGIPRVEILYHSIHYLDLIRSFLGEPKGVYAKCVRHPKAGRLAATRSSIILDYGDRAQVTVTANHHHEFGPRHQQSTIQWEGTRGAIKAQMGVLQDYPRGRDDWFEYCEIEDGKEPEWHAVRLEGTWFPDAFIGSMASVMCYAEGTAKDLPTSVDDAFRTMALVEAAYQSSESGATKIPSE